MTSPREDRRFFDHRIAAAAVSTPRYVLRQLAAVATAHGDAETFRECRNCGTTVDDAAACPACGSTELAEYEPSDWSE